MKFASSKKSLIRLASSLPVGDADRRTILSILEKESSYDFASYVLTSQEGNPIPTNEVEGFLKGLGVNIKEGGSTKPSGPRWQRGYRVCIKAEKHKGEGSEVYLANDRRVGLVVDDGGGSKGAPVIVDFGREQVQFPNAQRSRGVGMYKATDYSSLKGLGPIEIIYKSDPSRKVLEEQRAIAAEYIARGESRGEKRSLNYYSGYVFGAANGKNGLYFSILAQQRASQDACAEGFPFRSFNPSKAEVLYIGRRGKRPRGWEEEWEKMKD